MRKQIKKVKRFARKHFNDDRAVIKAYFDTHPTRKLHIGAGKNSLADWLNSDYQPSSKKRDIIHIDALKPLPFEDESFDYLFNEHLIEHFTYAQGLRMLEETYRILKPGGRIRISTPDLLFLIELYQKDKSDLQLEYIRWATDTFIQDAACYEDTFVINNMLRDWGHLFIYDEKTLAIALTKAGFSEASRHALNESENEHLKNLENENRMPPGFLQLESFTMEAVKR